MSGLRARGLPLILLAACAGESGFGGGLFGLGDNDSAADDSGSSGWVDSGGGTDSGGDTADTGDVDLPPAECPEDNGYVGFEPHAARTLNGEARWTLDFDAAAEALGYTDCSYHRSYGEMVERQGHTWQCPDCEWFTIGDAEIDEGYADCYAQISTSEQLRTEHLGVGAVDGEPHFWRTGAQNIGLADMGATTGAGTAEDPLLVGWSDEATLDAGGGFVLTATGGFTVGERSDTPIEDEDVPRETPYAGGWPLCNPGGPSPTYTLAAGVTLPNARLVDQYGDAVDLWDFWGSYVVLDSSSPNCGPCQSLAKEEAAWTQSMAREGIDVEWITLLNESLSTVNLPADAEMLDTWVSAMGTTGPVLADEGYAYTLFPAYTGSDSGMSYPTMIVVNRDMQVLGWDSGFGSEADGGTGFSAIEDLIRADYAQ